MCSSDLEREIEYYNFPFGVPPYVHDASDRSGVASQTTRGLMVAVSHSMDLGEAESYSALGFRIGVNYVIYSMSH